MITSIFVLLGVAGIQSTEFPAILSSRRARNSRLMQWGREDMDNIILSIYKNPTNNKKDGQKIIEDDSTALQYREKRKHNRNKKKFVIDFSKTNDNIGEKVCVKKLCKLRRQCMKRSCFVITSYRRNVTGLL